MQQVPFGVGKRLLTHILQGNKSIEAITKNSLHTLKSFGALEHKTRDEIYQLIARLVSSNYLKYQELTTNRFIKVLALTKKGRDEILDPQGLERVATFAFKEEALLQKERTLIDSLRFFLEKYSDEQAKAIISQSDKILCVAGAGSGKTTVLTKRIEFLVKFKSTAQEKILAITFTKKARAQMRERLGKLGLHHIHVHTFNSFAETVLLQYWQGTKSPIISYSQKIMLTKRALQQLRVSFKELSDNYFTTTQRKLKSQDELVLTFVNDCFYVLDHYKNENKELENFTTQFSTYKEKKNATYLYDTCRIITRIMQKEGLRDYGDQVKDLLTLFEREPSSIPSYAHVLVDEYQDVNSIQIDLLHRLSPANLFVVGDPRQAIFGWRGSKIQYIKEFQVTYPNATVIVLKENYRSHPKIVDVANDVVRTMNIQTQRAGKNEDEFCSPETTLFNFTSESLERNFVAREIKSVGVPNEQIFVLARTNRQLKEMAQALLENKIPHVLKTDETRAANIKKGHVTLATVHAIKGLEARVVFVIGCNSLHFPCKVSDHPIIESLNLQSYDKEEEERRLLYVAITRAKERLYLSYSGTFPTYFLSTTSRKLLGEQEFVEKVPKPLAYSANSKNEPQVYARLREWRLERSRELGVPAYMVLNNKSIEQIASLRPIHKEQLYSIYGLGDRKIEKFGTQILELVNG